MRQHRGHGTPKRGSSGCILSTSSAGSAGGARLPSYGMGAVDVAISKIKKYNNKELQL